MLQKKRDRSGRSCHRHIKKQTTHWPGPPVFVDTCSYITNCHKTQFGAVCEVSVLLCPWIQCHCCMQWQACQLWPISRLFLLDVSGSYLHHGALKNGPNPASFCLFLFFSQYNDNYSTNLTINDIKAQMVCLGFEPRVAGWKAQMDPLSYGGTPHHGALQQK